MQFFIKMILIFNRFCDEQIVTRSCRRRWLKGWDETYRFCEGGSRKLKIARPQCARFWFFFQLFAQILIRWILLRRLVLSERLSYFLQSARLNTMGQFTNLAKNFQCCDNCTIAYYESNVGRKRTWRTGAVWFNRHLIHSKAVISIGSMFKNMVRSPLGAHDEIQQATWKNIFKFPTIIILKFYRAFSLTLN